MKTPWVLIDTETVGTGPPTFVIQLAAQRMRGWEPEGEPFYKLLNHDQDIPPESAAAHGLTREFLERDGELPKLAYCAFSDYVGDLPLASFDLEHNLSGVLEPEWKRLGIATVGSRGFCAARLAQRLLDPLPAGYVGLQTLREYYRLPQPKAAGALGNLQTVVGLVGRVLRPAAEHRDLRTWQQLVEYASEEWYPSRITFGRHKGRLFQEARRDVELRRWLEWLSESSNTRAAKMGCWYLQRLASAPSEEGTETLLAAEESKDGAGVAARLGSTGVRRHGCEAVAPAGIAIYVNPEVEKLRELVAAARARLADIETTYTKEKARVDALQATLFQYLRAHYEKRERLRLVIEYRKKFLESLIRGGDEEAEAQEEAYEQARRRSEKDYAETEAEVAHKTQLTAEEEAKLAQLWKKLVKLYHPDRFAHEPDKLDTYEKLTAAINRAKDNGDLGTLNEIAADPHAFILRQGWTSLDFSEEQELAKLRRLYQALQFEIITVLESLGRVKSTQEYELCQLSTKQPDLLREFAGKRAVALEKEIAELEQEAGTLAQEIKELSGAGPARIL
jgi:DNA polymerase-3 subunit epsilon